MPTTKNTPKCFAEVGGKRILDWALAAFRANGVLEICFIGGYLIDVVRAEYPELSYRHNADWERNNILASLMHAEDLMDDHFICCYSDILFTPEVIERALNNAGDLALVIDTEWTQRYRFRTDHPADDAEKVTVDHGLITRIHREIGESSAYGEFIGVSKFSPAGAALFKEHYHRCQRQYAGANFREAAVFERAYLIQLYQEMLEQGVPIRHIDTAGQYMEIDTQQDFELARARWNGVGSGDYPR
jgi:choline kinase